MDQLVLTAQVALEGGEYMARLEALGLEGTGESVQQAQNELIDTLRSWIETHETSETLAQALADAGFPGLEEDTEIQLEFLSPPEE